ncbi:MAG: DUF2797 domain-containing protein [Glaciecola sp.]
MTIFQGNIKKMRVGVSPNNQVTYQLPIGENLVDMNALIGKSITVTHSGVINCVHCSRKTNKSFNQGYCFVCLRSLAQCDTCIIKPELCHYTAGTCREPEWGESHCLQDHFVYLSNTGQIKVGITKFVNDGNGVSSRWIDQGASQAIAIYRVKERLLSGLIETEIAKHMGDKTNWRTMLKGQPETLELATMRDKVHVLVAEKVAELQQQHGLQAIQPLDTPPVIIDYPVTQYPVKIKSINLDKEKVFTGTLLGIKGQYLMLDADRVINIRKYTGYDWNIEVA